MKKTRIYLNDSEWKLLIHSLNDFRSKLLQAGQYTDIVDEVMSKVMTAPTKRVKMKPSDGTLAGCGDRIQYI